MIFGICTFGQADFCLESLSHIFRENCLAGLCGYILYSKIEVFKDEVHHGISSCAWPEERCVVSRIEGCCNQRYIPIAAHEVIVTACSVHTCESEEICLFGCRKCRRFYTLNHQVGTADFNVGSVP